MELRPFQKRFLRRALAADVDTAALSIPRGNGKSFLAAHILERALTPGDSLNVPGAEYVLGASSIEQARLTFRFVKAALEPTGQYRFTDSYTRIRDNPPCHQHKATDYQQQRQGRYGAGRCAAGGAGRAGQL